MKRIFTITFIIVALLHPIMAQQSVPDCFKGKWWLGVIEDAWLPINITFIQSSEGFLQPVVYSPLQGESPIAVSKWSFVNDTLRIHNKEFDLKLVLRWNASDSSFDGKLVQRGMSVQMRFTQTYGLFKLARPQTPQKPYPYLEEDVVRICRKNGVTLTGTLTIPKGKGPFPAVVLVSGSGQQNRDEELAGHRPFLVLSDYLARRGIAVLRYDDRGMGGSKGEVQNATTLDFADDAEEMLSLLYKDKRVDPKRVGIVGHSEGALIACIVASRNKKVAGIVLLGGQGGSGADILLQQNEQLFLSMDVPQKLVDVRLDCMRAMFSIVDSLPANEYLGTFQKVVAERTAGLTDEERRQIGMRRSDVMLWATQIQMPWMLTFLKLDNAEFIKKSRCPILAIAGEKDLQVPPSNLEKIAVHSAGRAETHIMPSLNHLMQHCTTGLPKEYFEIEETMSEEVMALVVSWILEKMRR